jgi:hypothetical protein
MVKIVKMEIMAKYQVKMVKMHHNHNQVRMAKMVYSDLKDQTKIMLKL